MVELFYASRSVCIHSCCNSGNFCSCTLSKLKPLHVASHVLYIHAMYMEIHVHSTLA